MSYTLSQTEKDQIQAYLNAENYVDGYRYVESLLDTAVANDNYRNLKVAA